MSAWVAAGITVFGVVALVSLTMTGVLLIRSLRREQDERIKSLETRLVEAINSQPIPAAMPRTVVKYIHQPEGEERKAGQEIPVTAEGLVQEWAAEIEAKTGHKPDAKMIKAQIEAWQDNLEYV